MKTFLSKFGAAVRGVLSGFDRVCFRGTLRNLSYPMGLRPGSNQGNTHAGHSWRQNQLPTKEIRPNWCKPSPKPF